MLKKSSLMKKIWKYTKLSPMNKAEASELKSKIYSLLKLLNEVEMDILLTSLQSQGGVDTECVCMKASDVHKLKRRVHSEPKFILAKVFRYPNLTTSDYLRNLICCNQHNCCVDDLDECINPYHSSLVVSTDSPLPPYSSKKPDLSPHITSVPQPRVDISTTDLVEQSGSASSTGKASAGSSSGDSCCTDGSSIWCRITYWEQKQRVGRLFDVRQDCVNVFEDLPQGDGLCLSLLAQGTTEQSESTKLRELIGYGFQLTREPDGVWLYNRSDIVLFVGSPTIQIESVDVSHPVIKRLPPGSSILVCNPNLLHEVQEKYKLKEASCTVSSVGDTEGDLSGTANWWHSIAKPFCIRVSFGKGWGPSYTRMSVNKCPCWVEIYLNV